MEARRCECGCGALTSVATRTRSKLGHVRGESIRFIHGHATKGKALGPMSEAHREACSLAQRGKKTTASHRAKIAASLRGDKNPAWDGGRHVDYGGYVRVTVAGGGRRHEHRIVMESLLGRDLTSVEVVHHVNGNHADNRPENLWLFPDNGLHMQWHAILALDPAARPELAEALGCVRPAG